MEHAGFWRRSAAGTIDSILLLILLFVLDNILILNFFYKNIFCQTLIFFYYVGMTSTKYQGTIGQILFKVKIGDLEGNKLSSLQSSIRYLLCALPSFPFIVYTSLPQTIAFGSKLETIAAEFESKIQTLSENQGNALIENLMKTPEVALQIQYFATVLLIMLISCIIWTLPIAFTKQKTGIHDLIARQRAFKR